MQLCLDDNEIGLSG